MRFAEIATAALLVDTATLGILQATGYGGRQVRQWYKTLGASAYAMDVLSLIIGAYVAQLIAPDTLWKQLVAVLFVQMAHDLAFGWFVSSKHARGPLMRLFRSYAREMGVKILIADAVMMLATVFVAHRILRFDRQNPHENPQSDWLAFVASVTSYVGLLLVHSV